MWGNEMRRWILLLAVMMAPAAQAQPDGEMHREIQAEYERLRAEAGLPPPPPPPKIDAREARREADAAREARMRAASPEERRALLAAEHEAWRQEYDAIRLENEAARERYFAEHGHYGEGAPDLPSRAPDMTPCGNSGMAFVMSQRALRNSGMLVAPASAKFGHSPLASAFLGDCRWRVVGDVDAQNAFGAQLRHRYSVAMEYEPASNTWRAHDLNIVPMR